MCGSQELASRPRVAWMSPCSIEVCVLRRLRVGGWPLQDIAYVLATGYVGLSILLSGVFVRPSQLKIPPLLWLYYISYPR